MDKLLLDYYSQDDFVAGVWKSKYAAKKEVTPDDMHRRMAREFAKIRHQKDQSKTMEEWETYFFYMFQNFQSVNPQGRVMSGLGVDDSYRSLSNCLRLPPPKDSYSSIMYTDTMLVSAAKRGCGYGIGISKLRPSGSPTTNAANTSSGVIGFGNRFSNSTHEVGQQGRRGACLLDLDIKHPDAPYWAVAKMDERIMTGANISFKAWNSFMVAVQKNEDYILRWPCETEDAILWAYPEMADLEYDQLVELEEGLSVKKVRARSLWDAAIHGVWSDGCPGLQFWEKIVNYDPASVYKKYEIDGTNACGEQPKAVGDTCRLLAQNLFGAVDNPFDNGTVNFERLYQTSYDQLVLGDDLVDLECIYVQRIIDKIKADPEPIEEKAIELALWVMVLDMAKSGRRVGCGITALGDMIAAVGLRYDSKEALELVDRVMYTKMKAEFNATIDLAKKFGPFAGWDKHLQYEFDQNDLPVKGKNEFYQFLLDTFYEEVLRECKYGRRNVNWSTIAPTGTLSIITKLIKYPNVSSGCEPQFALWFFRNKKVTDNEAYDYIDEVGIKWKTYPVIMGGFREWIDIYHAKQGLSSPDVDSLSKEALQALLEVSPYYKSCADDIDWHQRIQMQAILQKYTTSAISSTINLPSDVKEEVIGDLYMESWKAGLKGITCYRDKSKKGVLVKENNHVAKFDYKDSIKRPKNLESELHIVTAMGRKYAVTVGLLNGKPYEVFAFRAKPEIVKLGKLKGEVVKVKKGHYNFVNGQENHTIEDMQIKADSGQEQMVTRLVSGMLRHGAKPQFVMEQIDKCDLEVVEFGTAIKRVLKKYVKEEELVKRATCKSCGSTNLKVQEGCLSCNDCGDSKCG